VRVHSSEKSHASEILNFFSLPRLIPETKGRSLEDMDIIFGSISAEERRAHIEQHDKGENTRCLVVVTILTNFLSPESHRITV
jgi:hypothetical protein